jgi:hypothetical protein
MMLLPVGSFSAQITSSHNYAGTREQVNKVSPSVHISDMDLPLCALSGAAVISSLGCSINLLN